MLHSKLKVQKQLNELNLTNIIYRAIINNKLKGICTTLYTGLFLNKLLFKITSNILVNGNKCQSTSREVPEISIQNNKLNLNYY